MTSPANRRSTALTVAMTLAVGVVLLAAASERLRGLLANTGLLAIGTLGIALPLGAPLGVVLAKTDLPGRRIIAWLLAGFLFVPLYVQAAAWNAVLGTGGWISRLLAGDGYSPAFLDQWRGAIWVHGIGATPWVALLTAGALATVERRLEEESLLDAAPLTVLWRVTLRRGIGGVAAAAIWVAVMCATEISVTDLYQVRTFAEEIYTQASLGFLSGEGGALGWADLAIGVSMIGVLVFLALRLIAPWLPSAIAIDDDAVWKWRPATGRPVIAGAVWLLVIILFLAPLAALVWKAGISVRQQGDGYLRLWSPAKAAAMIVESPWENRREWGWSFSMAIITAAVTTSFGLMLAWIVRWRRNAWIVLSGFIAAALAIPGPLWGVWTILALNHPWDSVFSWLTTLYDRTLLAPILVQTVRCLPLVTIWLWSQFASVPQEVLESARVEGATATQRLLYVAIPLRRRGVLGAVFVAWILSLGELSATLLVAPPGVTPISVRIFQLLHYGVDDRVAALSLSVFVLLGLGVAVLALRDVSRRRTVR